MTVTILWPDGHIDEAPCWRALMEHLEGEEWPGGTRSFRKELAHRARVWGGRKVSLRGTAGDFMRALAAAKLFTIKEDGDA
jgi:hypothetical protein